MKKSFFLTLLLLLFATACSDDDSDNDIAETLYLESPTNNEVITLDSLAGDSLHFEWSTQSDISGDVIYTVILDKSSNITTADEDDGSVLRYDVYNETELALSYNFLDSLPHFQTIINDTLKVDSLYYTVFVRNSSSELRSAEIFKFTLQLKSN
ncbi:hypothetical protein Ctha_1944 [Chloroherpeton thalassium ATCC 35110]|uniref:Lipoprotein n=1 Tax=Chloroherpeton thalassium (strain ATCC 35110 / GB-78) TaxID=517418 RepID=B3QUE9_CHLT3|nr:SusE domain-containing protein [Chloroherpeton thalassium]ACF14398.1 hypothetical protein Ctha_1944 [Chloroherpeton thalassium ATCC 35110]